MKCRQCGKDNVDNIKFCFYCGTPLLEDAANAMNSLGDDNQKTHATASKKNRKKILLIIVAAVTLTTFISVLFDLPRNQIKTAESSQIKSTKLVIEETTIEKGNIIDSGTSGECLWELDDNGLLCVNGNGKMADYSAYETPWYSKRLQIKYIFLEEGVTGVGIYAFMDCENLLTVRLSKHLNKINDAAFYKCNSLKEIRIPQSTHYIGFNAFGACRNLTQIIVDEKNDYYTSIDGNLFTKDKSTLMLYAIGKTDSSYSIPSGTKKIGDDAFEKSPYLVRITIPDSAVSIGKWAFEYCTSLLYVEIPPSVIEIGDNAFEQCLDNLSIIGQSNSYAESFAVKNGIRFTVRD